MSLITSSSKMHYRFYYTLGLFKRARFFTSTMDYKFVKTEKITVFNMDFFKAEIYFDGIVLNSTKTKEVEQQVS